MVYIEIIELEANAGEAGRMTTSQTKSIGASKSNGTAEAKTNNDDDAPLVRLARVVKVSIGAGFVDSAMLLNLEKAYNPPVPPPAEAEAEGTNNIAPQASASAIVGPSNNMVGTANDAEAGILFGEDMWETLARHYWPKCGEMFLTAISKMTTYRDLFVKGTTSDRTNGGWFEKVCADIGGGRAALEFYVTHSRVFDEVIREDASEDAADTITNVLAALTYLKMSEDAQRLDDGDEDEDEGVNGGANVKNEHYSRATIALEALPKLVGLLKSAAVPANIQGGALYLLGSIDFVEDVVSAGAIQPAVDLLGSSDDPKVQYCILLLLNHVAKKEPNCCGEMIQASIFKAMLSYVERKKSSSWNQESPAEGLLLPDDGEWNGRTMFLLWGILLRKLTTNLPLADAIGMEQVIPSLASLIGEPLFYLSDDQSSIGRAVDSMLWSVLNLCRISRGNNDDKIPTVLFNAGFLTTLFTLVDEGLNNGISEGRLAAALIILNQGFTAPGRGSHVQAIVDAGFLDVAIQLLESDLGEVVKGDTCGVLLSIAQVGYDYVHADFCMTIARIAAETAGDIEAGLVMFLVLLLQSLTDKRLAPLEGSPLKMARYLFWRKAKDVKVIDDLVVNLIEKGFVELLLTKLESANDDTVIGSIGSIRSMIQLCRIKEMTAIGDTYLSLKLQVVMPLLSVMERHEHNKGIQKVSSRALKGVLKGIHPYSSGRSKRFFRVFVVPFAMGVALCWSVELVRLASRAK